MASKLKTHIGVEGREGYYGPREPLCGQENHGRLVFQFFGPMPKPACKRCKRILAARKKRGKR